MFTIRICTSKLAKIDISLSFLRFKIYRDITLINHFKEESNMLVHCHKIIWFYSFVMVISKLFHSPGMVYLLSGTEFGFPERKVLPENLMRKCGNQDWSGLQIRSGLMEGNGIFAQEHFVKNTPLCNYGGVQVTSNYAKYVKICETTDDGIKHIYLNCHPTGSKTYGQLLNYSSLHPNAITKIYATGKNKLDVIFVVKHDIRVDEEIVWDYGKNYTGVNPCVTSCFKCKNIKK